MKLQPGPLRLGLGTFPTGVDPMTDLRLRTLLVALRLLRRSDYEQWLLFTSDAAEPLPDPNDLMWVIPGYLRCTTDPAQFEACVQVDVGELVDEALGDDDPAQALAVMVGALLSGAGTAAQRPVDR